MGSFCEYVNEIREPYKEDSLWSLAAVNDLLRTSLHRAGSFEITENLCVK